MPTSVIVWTLLLLNIYFIDMLLRNGLFAALLTGPRMRPLFSKIKLLLSLLHVAAAIECLFY